MIDLCDVLASNYLPFVSNLVFGSVNYKFTSNFLVCEPSIVQITTHLGSAYVGTTNLCSNTKGMVSLYSYLQFTVQEG